MNFRGGKHTKYDNHMIVKLVDNRKKASELIGKKVFWQSPKGKKINGVINAAHGNSGCVRVVFEKGMPGQSLWTKVSVV
mgnify:FL=1